MGDNPSITFDLLPKGFSIVELPDQCPSLTEFTFDPDSTPETRPVKVALGYASQEAKDSVYAEMAARLAGTYQKQKDDCAEIFPETKSKGDITNLSSFALAVSVLAILQI